MTGTWEFSSVHGHTRTEDGLRFDWSSYPSKEPMKAGDPDWVWMIYRPGIPPVWVDPVKKGLEDPAGMRRHADEKWPPVPTGVQR
jgi:hypothetical protein